MLIYTIFHRYLSLTALQPIVDHGDPDSSLPQQTVESVLMVNPQYSELEHVPQAGAWTGLQASSEDYGKNGEAQMFNVLPERKLDRNLTNNSHFRGGLLVA